VGVVTAREQYAAWIHDMPNTALVRETVCMIQGSVDSQGRDSPFHWKADKCHDEADRRGRDDLYVEACARAGN
jgi:hypothetical protein